MNPALAYPNASQPFRIAPLRFDSAAYEEVVVSIANRVVGTGGATTLAYCSDRRAMGYPLIPVANYSANADAHPSAATHLENLEKIRAVLNPAISDLARALDISRQSIYDWMGGGTISAENAKKLQDVARVAQLFEDAGLRGSNQLLRREIGGKSFYDRVHAGESTIEAGAMLVVIARKEAEQRATLNKRLNSRAALSISAEDFGAPHLSETD